MKFVVVDDERLALENMHSTLEKVCPTGQIVGFQDPDEALEYLRLHGADVAFLDVEMPEIGGLELARLLKVARPSVNIVFVTAYMEYAVDAFALHASGYLLKPVTVERVGNELENLRAPLRGHIEDGLYVQTFGSFEVFYNGCPMQFARGKAKELLAYLVDRKGAGCTSSHLCAVLWEEKEYDFSLQRQFQTVVSELMKTLRSVDSEDVLIKRRNFLAVDSSKLNCDYFRFLRGEISGINAYAGEYMCNYSWAEFTTGFLNGSRKL